MKKIFLLAGVSIVLSFSLASNIFAINNPYGDLTNNNIVEMNDLRLFAALWLVDDCNLTTEGIDLNSDCSVNFYEFSQFANNWKIKSNPLNLMVPPMAYDENTIILIWSKPADYSQVTDYRVYQNGVALGLSGRFDTTRAKLYYNVTGLTANTTYNFTVKSLNLSCTEIGTSNICTTTTAATPAIFYPETYGAAANGTTNDTAAIKAAINACTVGGKVHLRTGKTFLSGAIYLKSNMTLQIDGTILGSSAVADYNLVSGKYTSLINASNGSNIRICGSGCINGCQGYSASNPHTITGSGITTLGTNQAKTPSGDGSRSNLVSASSVTNIYIGGRPGGGSLVCVYPSMHTITPSQCNGVTIVDVNCDTFDIHNADGIDLSSCDTAYIFNSKFDTGDDCIDMGCGIGKEGVDANLPDQNIRIFDCSTDRGHGGYVIGSHTAAWVQDTLVEDCFFKNTDVSNGIGIRMKTSLYTGGGARRITCRDIRINGPSQQGILLDSTYTFNGTTHAGPGQFSGNTFKNITIASTGESIKINGLSGTPDTSNIFINITGNKKANLNYCTNSSFTNVTVTGWTIGSGCSGNTSSGSPGCPF
jgi:exo-poly-alpha-galacturonosidase